MAIRENVERKIDSPVKLAGCVRVHTDWQGALPVKPREEREKESDLQEKALSSLPIK